MKNRTKWLKIIALTAIMLVFSMCLVTTAFAGEKEDAAAEDAAASANGTYNENNKPTETPTVVTTAVNIDLREGDKGEYSFEVKLNSTAEITSFNIEMYLPGFARVTRVEKGYSLAQGEYDVFQSNIEYDQKFSTIYNSSEMLSGENTLFTVYFELIMENIWNGISESPTIGHFEFTNTSVEAVHVNYEAQPINILMEQLPVMKGDVDGNGTIELADLMMAQRYVITNGNEGVNNWDNSDINNDGCINLADCQYIQMYLVGRITSLDNIQSSNPNDDMIEVMVYLQMFDKEGGINSSVEYVKASYNIPVQEFIDKYGFMNRGHYVGVYSDYDCKDELDYGRTIGDVKEIYIKYYEVQTEVNGIRASFHFNHTDGIVFNSLERADIAEGTYAYDYAMVVFNESFGSAYTVNGIYTNADMTEDSRLTSDMIIYDGMQIYISLSNRSIWGNYDIIKTEYTSTGMETTVNVGTAEITESGIIITVNGKASSYTYSAMDGEIIIVNTGEYSMVMYSVEIFATDAENGRLVVSYEYDGSKNEITEEYAAVAGSYTVINEQENDSYELTLFDNGVYRLVYINDNMTLVGSYTYSGNIFIMDVFGNESKAELVDAENRIMHAILVTDDVVIDGTYKLDSGRLIIRENGAYYDLIMGAVKQSGAVVVLDDWVLLLTVDETSIYNTVYYVEIDTNTGTAVITSEVGPVEGFEAGDYAGEYMFTADGKSYKGELRADGVATFYYNGIKLYTTYSVQAYEEAGDVVINFGEEFGNLFSTVDFKLGDNIIRISSVDNNGNIIA